MNCPYCQSEVHDEAVVCRVCRRDFSLVRSLVEKIAALEIRVGATADPSAYLARIADLEHQLEERDAQAQQEPATVGNVLANLVAYLLIPLVLLLAAHALVTIVFDVNVIYLRILAILLPLPFGFFLFKSRARHFGPWMLGVIVLALVSVIGMSGITSLVDGTPVMPQNLFEWKEVVEFAASIAFSYLTGMLIGAMALAAKTPKFSTQHTGPLVRLMSAAVDNGKLSPEKLHKKIKKLQEYGGTIVAFCTTCVSIYTGLKSFL